MPQGQISRFLSFVKIRKEKNKNKVTKQETTVKVERKKKKGYLEGNKREGWRGKYDLSICIYGNVSVKWFTLYN
jgi:hypothetical protein